MENNLMENLRTLTAMLETKKSYSLNMTIGLDGFVDEIIQVVDKRQDFENFTTIKTIKEYGARISNAAGLSTNLEMVSVQTKLGGNGPILSNALLTYGVNLTYIGAIGVPSIHPVFEEMASKSKAVYSLANPGHTHALEFDDGKIIMGKLNPLMNITWEHFKFALGGISGVASIFDQCHLFGMQNWTMLPHMSHIWQGITEEVFPLLPNLSEKPFAFFDLADPQKRTVEDIIYAMRLISKFEDKFRTILGLNEKELYQVSAALDIHCSSLEDTALALYSTLGIYCVVVHPVKNACCVVDGKFYYTDGPFCQTPKLTTGAGDNFNAGFCLGQALGLDPLLSITLGVCTSGFYVRNAKSPTFDEVMDFAQCWSKSRL